MKLRKGDRVTVSGVVSDLRAAGPVVTVDGPGLEMDRTFYMPAESVVPDGRAPVEVSIPRDAVEAFLAYEGTHMVRSKEVQALADELYKQLEG